MPLNTRADSGRMHKHILTFVLICGGSVLMGDTGAAARRRCRNMQKLRCCEEQQQSGSRGGQRIDVRGLRGAMGKSIGQETYRLMKLSYESFRWLPATLSCLLPTMSVFPFLTLLFLSLHTKVLFTSLLLFYTSVTLF